MAALEKLRRSAGILGRGRLWAVPDNKVVDPIGQRCSALLTRPFSDLSWVGSITKKTGNEIVDEGEAKIEGRLHGEQIEPEQPDSMLLRLIYMLLIAVMISLAQTVLGVATVVQFVVMLVNKKQPNERLADFGTDLGIWIAKAARFQTAASNVKPWPWTELD